MSMERASPLAFLKEPVLMTSTQVLLLYSQLVSPIAFCGNIEDKFSNGNIKYIMIFMMQNVFVVLFRVYIHTR